MADITFKVIEEKMTTKSKVDEILDDNDDFENRQFRLICQLARELEDKVAKLKMENEELHEILSLANRQENTAYNYRSHHFFPTFGR